MPSRRPNRPPRPQTAPTPPRPSTAAPPAYTPPPGFPADPEALLAYLAAGEFTDAQARYLRSVAFAQYVAGVNATRGLPGMEATTAMGDRIIAAWLAALAVLGPAPVTNPFA